ncbi:MAG: beta-Ala-His dipeptidase [Clostridiaceae bacterium]|nr:beta-Ala-His dipeptidase [Clostridiaceae bacterium]
MPRGSGNNQGISDYLVDFAGAHGLWCHQDQALNVIIRREAAAGKETLPGVILQGHMDMVCEKESGVKHDFTAQGLDLKTDGDFLYAEGTTLGGDDGIALAYGLAVLADTEKDYPMLELIVTTDEETGMGGAKALDMSLVKGSYVINLDTEEEGSLLAGCAGGLRGNLRLPLEYAETTGVVCKICISGLQGGHSGVEIDKNRTNAVLLLARLLYELPSDWFSIVSMQGGQKDNAIPREAQAELVWKEETAVEGMAQAEKLLAGCREELAGFEPELKYQCSACGVQQRRALTAASQKKVLFYLNTAPNGVQAVSGEVDGLVETSLNLGIFTLQEEMKASYAIRSSRLGAKEYVSSKLGSYAEFLGGAYQESDAYPAWVFRKDSKLREKMVKVYQEQFGRPPKVEVIHAGLECGIFCEKRPDLDIVAMGPDILDIHTPKERMSISSAVRMYQYLERVLNSLGAD